MSVDIGAMDQDIVIQSAGAPLANDDGGYTETYTDLVPLWWASFESPSAGNVQRTISNTILSVSSVVLRMRYLDGITTKSRILKPAPSFASRPEDDDWAGRILNVTGVVNPHEDAEQLLVACAEVVA